jgi:hypothetical protein
LIREITLLLHFIGLGLLLTTLLAGFFLHRHYLKTTDIQARAVILRAGKPIGLLSPVGMVLMLITGIGNMHAIGVGLLTLGWLSAKIVFFAFAVIGGILLAVTSKKRARLVGSLASGEAAAGTEEILSSVEKQISLGYAVMSVLFLVILYLSVIGRLGAQ